jgi:alpha-beta hydrolase superfamily lysophospholipase
VLVHGYTHYCRGFGFRLAGPLVRAGYYVTGIDALGHGTSNGLHGLVCARALVFAKQNKINWDGCRCRTTTILWQIWATM